MPAYQQHGARPYLPLQAVWPRRTYRHHSPVLILTLALAFVAFADANASARRKQNPLLSTSELAKKSSASVVTITTPSGLGSGVIVNNTGVIVTNLHVIRGETIVTVRLANGDEYHDVSVIDVDERKDLVVLKIKAFGLTAATLGNSDRVQVGDRVIVIGSPRGLDQSVSDGLVSAIRDSGDGYHLFQTSAAASPGSSGGGMFNQRGELIAIVSSKLTSGENINFAIPINYVRGLLSTNLHMTLTDLAVRFPPVPANQEATAQQAQSAAAPPATPDPAAVEKFTSVVLASGLKVTRISQVEWSTVFKGNEVSSVAVYITLLGNLVVTQSAAGDSTGMSAKQLAAALEFSYSIDLAKVGISDHALMTMNETELRLLDGPALNEIVNNVATYADALGGALKTADASPTTPPALTANPPASGSSASLDLLNGHAVLTYDSTKWTLDTQNQTPNTFYLTYASGDLYAKLMAERIQVPEEKIPELVLANMRSSAPDAAVTGQGYRTVNGLRMVYVGINASVQGVPFSYIEYAYSDPEGTIELIAYTGKNLMKESQPMIDAFVSGLVVRR